MSTRKSSASRPTTDTGSSGSFADSATASANGMFLLELGLDERLVVRELEAAEPQSSASHSSSGTESDAASQVDISGV